jgi:hypothetical protein
LAFFLRGLANVDHLADQLAPIFALHEQSLAERALANLLDFLVAALLENASNVGMQHAP